MVNLYETNLFLLEILIIIQHIRDVFSSSFKEIVSFSSSYFGFFVFGIRSTQQESIQIILLLKAKEKNE